MNRLQMKLFLSYLLGKKYTNLKNFLRRLENRGKVVVNGSVFSSKEPFNNAATIEEGPLVSVVMTVYNRERFLEQAIKSVLAQTYKNWELIIVDDGSTDSSASVVKHFNDPRIKTFFLQHRGQLGALRFGFDSCRGDYVARLDSDDMFVPQCIEKYVERMIKEKELSFAYSPLLEIDEEGRILGLWGATGLTSGQQVLRWVYKTGYTAIPDVAFWKKDYCPFIIENYLEKSMPFYIDNILKVKFTVLQDPMYIYRIHGNNYQVQPKNFAAVAMGRLATLDYLVEHYSFSDLTGIDEQDVDLQKLNFARRYYYLSLDFLASSYENFGRSIPPEVSGVIHESLLRSDAILKNIDERKCSKEVKKLKSQIDSLMMKAVTKQ